MKAAAIVNMRRGWKDPMKIREEHIKQIVDDCMDVLRKLPEYSWLRYKSGLQSRGYEVKTRYGGKPFCPVAYTIKLGNSVYKASELGVGRKLMASKLEQTWMQLPRCPNRLAAAEALIATGDAGKTMMTSGGHAVVLRRPTGCVSRLEER